VATKVHPEKKTTDRRFFVPEVVQTSEMDCGPASLKALLEGFGIYTSYGRLREACQTSVDGTSIDTLEDLAVQLGLEAEQIMLPADHILLEETKALPALVVVRLPNGLTHFVVVWSQLGRWVQVMDPGTGRRWVSRQNFLDELYIHRFPVPARAWREWAGTPGFLDPLRRRLRDLRLSEKAQTQQVNLALEDPGSRGLATLDAATRLTASLVQAGAVEPGPEAENMILQLVAHDALPPSPLGRGAGGEVSFSIPSAYWSVEPYPTHADEEHLLLRGAVMVRATGRRGIPHDLPETENEALPPELAAVLSEPPVNLGRAIWETLRQDGVLIPSLLAAAFGMAALGVTIQALLLQGLLRLGQSLAQMDQRFAAIAALLAFLFLLFLLELPATATMQRMGRRLETRLRIAFLEKLPRLSDRYFHSRLTSDMTQRAHGLRALRSLPSLGFQLLNTLFQLVLTAIGVIWLQPRSAPLAIFATVAFIALAWAAQHVLEESDLRLRSHSGGLSRFYLDAMLGLIPLRTHSAERAFRREHESLLVEWMRAGLNLAQATVVLQGIGALLYSGFAIWVVFDYVAQGGAAGGVLLLFYWTLNLPALGQALAQQIQQYPMMRNSLLRILEPLGAAEDAHPADDAHPKDAAHPAEEASQATDNPGVVPNGVAIEMQNVSIQAGGHTILAEINLNLAPGEHLAVVGPSGAGKSTLVGILLGWHRPTSGECKVDGQILTGEALQSLRRVTAWVDPAVQLWNRTLLENLTYGNDTTHATGHELLLEDADLFGVFERLEKGLQTMLGEGGGLVSGGEGQRVRLGRAMNRTQPRLVILDEPFRGLDREQRRALLKKARHFWREATLICITHDVGETQGFERVLVIENGRIVERGAPAELSSQPESRYRALLEAENTVRQGMWGDAPWRRLWVEEGRLTEAKETDR
jgi:ATP-binding cassette subfamily B protein